MSTQNTKQVETENNLCGLCGEDTYKLIKVCNKHSYCEGCKENIKKIYFGYEICMICIENIITNDTDDLSRV